MISINPEGATLTPYSKTAQGGESEDIHIQPGIALRCLKRWIETAASSRPRPFSALSTRPGRWHGAPQRGSIARIVKASCAAADLEAREFAGHSLRAGMVTSAAENGVAEWRIRLTSRHRSDVLRQYIR